MYPSTTQEKLRLTEQKLAATERLLELEKAQHKVTKIQSDAWKESHRIQQINTGSFWESTRKAEAKLKAIQELLDRDREQFPRSSRYARLREVMGDE